MPDRAASGHRRRSRWRRPDLEPLAAWAVAAALFLATLALRLELVGAGRHDPFLAFFPAILLAAWLCGRAQAWATTGAGGLAAWWFLIRTPGIVAWPSLPEAAALAAFGAIGALTTTIVAGLALAAQRAEAAAEQAQSELAAQQVLTAELQHRVANNLQMVASALVSQARQFGGAEREALHEATRRLDAMGRLSRALVRTEAQPDPERVIEDLARTQVEAAGLPRIAVVVTVAPSLPLDGGRLTTLGMIVSEAISNALKHGFSGRSTGRIAIRLQPSGASQIALEVRDDGAGLPPGFALARSTSLGLRIVQSLAQRLGGTLSLADEQGAVLRVVFPLAGPARA